MTDVVAVALASGGFSLLGASVGALTTYKVNLRNSETTISTAKAQCEVEIAKIQAENQRLRDSNREEERRNRQSTYHRYLNALVEIYQLMGFAAPVKTINKLRDDYRYLHAGVVLFAPPSVRAAAYKASDVYNQAWPALDKQRQEHSEKSESECWRDATAEIRERLGKEITHVIDQMHADVTRGIAQDPQDG